MPLFTSYNFILNFIAGYVFLSYALYYFAGTAGYFYLNYVAAFSVVFFTFRAFTFWSYIDKRFLQTVVLSALFLALNLIVNDKNLYALSISIKYFSLYVFFIIGYYLAFSSGPIDSKIKVHHFLIVVLIPLLIAIVINIPSDSFDNSPFEFKNGAVRYFILTSFFAFFFFKRNLTLFIVYIVCITLLFNTISTFVAVVASVLIVLFYKYKYKALLYFGLFSAVALVLPFLFDIPIFYRVNSAYDVFAFFFSNYSLADLAYLEYGVIKSETGATETSAFFRMKHWYEITQIYWHAPMVQKLFGFGIGATKEVTTVFREPHNEYLRLLVEFGPINLFLFVYLNATIIQRVGIGILLLPLLIFLLNCFSANVFGNFLPIITLYFFLGSIVGQVEINKGYLENENTSG